ncbi:MULTISPECIES: hypothetical protein [unclassified Bradyrhizobium]|uniref:hypothetical protein n=1 Tax=unclassified Bradyrhizobium TaxID=2631580 RepID=UPI0028E69553|nr:MULTISPECIES: hypothetical protein [unclassified Bradyrhizobium]
MFDGSSLVLSKGDAEACVEVLVRYVSWFGHWIYRLIPTHGPQGRQTARHPGMPAQLSAEDLFYIAMLGPHV